MFLQFVLLTGLGSLSSQEGAISCNHKRPKQWNLVPGDNLFHQTTQTCILKNMARKETFSFITELVLLEVNMLLWCFKALVKVRWGKFSNVKKTMLLNTYIIDSQKCSTNILAGILNLYVQISFYLSVCPHAMHFFFTVFFHRPVSLGTVDLFPSNNPHHHQCPLSPNPPTSPPSHLIFCYLTTWQSAYLPFSNIFGFKERSWSLGEERPITFCLLT